MKRQARHEFDAWAETYDRSLLNHFLFRPSYLEFLTELVSWWIDRDDCLDVLDIGCGSGTFATLLACGPLPVRVVGLDYAPAMTAVAGRKAGRIGVRDKARFVAGDSEHLPFADASFDAVTCSNSFHHYPHQQQVVFEMRRVLRPGGRLMIIDGFRDNIVGWVVFDVIIAGIEKQVHHAPWPRMRDYFLTAGFTQIRHRKFNFWFPAFITIGEAPS